MNPAKLLEQAASESLAQRLGRTKTREDVTFFIEGREVPVISASISRSIDTMADGWTCEIEWIPGRDPELDRRIAPYTYARSQLYIGPRLVNTGRLYTVRPSLGPGGLTKQLECASYTADLVDSMMPPRFFSEWSGASLYDIARSLCQPMSIDVGIGSAVIDGRAGTPFDFVQAELTQTYSDLLTKLAFQRGMLVTNDKFGMLLLTMGLRQGNVMATLGEVELAAYVRNLSSGAAKSQTWSATFDGRKRFGTYAVYGQSGNPEEDGAVIQSEALDVKVDPARRTNIIVSENTASTAGITAAWHRSQKLVDALTIPFPVIGWYTPAGTLWDPNTFVVVKAPSLDINTATRFLVRQIDYEHTTGGQTATLYLVPPEVYTGDAPVEPWSGRWR